MTVKLIIKLNKATSILIEPNLSHQSREALDEIPGETLDHSKHHVVVLLFLLNTHQSHFLARLLHQRQEVLKFDIVGVAQPQHLIDQLD